MIIIVWLSDEHFNQNEMRNSEWTIGKKTRNEGDVIKSLQT